MAASPRPPSWAIGHTEFNAGVLGETALPGFKAFRCWVIQSAHRDGPPYQRLSFQGVKEREWFLVSCDGGIELFPNNVVGV